MPDCSTNWWLVGILLSIGFIGGLLTHGVLFMSGRESQREERREEGKR